MSKGNKQYRIDGKKWKEAEKYGWDIISVRDNGNLLNGRDSKDVNKNHFVLEKLPKLFNDFYQKVIDEGVAAGIDEDSMVETAEEYLATSLGESLIWFAGEVDPEVLKESK